ncbi:hypothetical protein KAI68_01465 [bacterium]|nr:hypothetical protein [bacterium]
MKIKGYINNKICFILLLVGILVLTQIKLEKKFVYPFPCISNLSLEEASFLNFWGVLLGFRRLSADLVWIKMLQYYGTRKEGDDALSKKKYVGVEKEEYKKLFPFFQAVVKLDPFFCFAYLYGSGILAYNHERYDEAVSLLEEGITSNPKYWKFNFYLGAIGYKIKKQEKKVIYLLEKIVEYPDCPVMIKSVLAQLYEKKLQHIKAGLIWENILRTSNDKGYRKKAEKHLQY